MISKKKETQLYGVVHEEIMQARIKIAKLMNGQAWGVQVDNILSDLCKDAPQKAINLFKPQKKLK